MVFPKAILILFVVALVCCSFGFKELVWFMSVGYGFAVMGIGLAQLIMFFNTSSLAVKLFDVLLVVYGFRLGYFLLMRELKNANYKKILDSTGSTKKVPIFVSLFMWLYCAAMYDAQTAALTYRVVNAAADNAALWIGLVITALGVVGEALSDKQKSDAKKVNPKRFCDTGLYKFARCPNYFSEILVWTGVFVSGFGALQGGQWAVTIIGYLLILVVMINGAQRLEKRHEKNYGSDPEYVKYADSTPILFPFIPLYHLNKVERKK